MYLGRKWYYWLLRLSSWMSPSQRQFISYVNKLGITASAFVSQKCHFKELLFCPFNVQFKFNDEFYNKIGLVRASPLGPLLVNCFEANLQNTNLWSTTESFHFCKRWVDDTFLVYDENTDLNNIMPESSMCCKSTTFRPYLELSVESHFVGVIFLKIWRISTKIDT